LSNLVAGMDFSAICLYFNITSAECIEANGRFIVDQDFGLIMQAGVFCTSQGGQMLPERHESYGFARIVKGSNVSVYFIDSSLLPSFPIKKEQGLD